MTCRNPFRFQPGFSLVELMVALVIGLFILAGLVTVFVNNSVLRTELTRSGQLVENGRYVMDLLSEDLRMAGYLGDYDPAGLALPGSTSSAVVCTNLANLNAQLVATMSFPVMGQSVGSVDAGLCSVSGVLAKANTSVLAIRRASTCVSTTTGCVDVGNDPLFQVSLCNAESATPYKISTDNSLMTLNKKDCSTTADIRKYLMRVYFVSPNHLPGDGIPTLYRLDLGVVSGTLAWIPTPLAEGVEAMVVRYGVDGDDDGAPDLLDTDGDSTPDTVYVTDPAIPCAADAACIATNWNNVVSVRVSLLVRTLESTRQYLDTKGYDVGGTAFGPFNDGYRRRVYDTTIPLNNVAVRRAK